MTCTLAAGWPITMTLSPLGPVATLNPVRTRNVTVDPAGWAPTRSTPSTAAPASTTPTPTAIAFPASKDFRYRLIFPSLYLKGSVFTLNE